MILFLSIFSFSLSLPLIPVRAMENGVDAPKDGRVVQLYDGQAKRCTGFLYTERIIFTAGHCLYNGMTDQLHSNPLSGYPEEVSYFDSPKILIEKYFLPESFEKRSNFGAQSKPFVGKNITEKNDFAIYILSKPIQVKGKVSVAIPSQIEQFIANKTPIRIIGYGKQDQREQDSYRATPKFAELTLISHEKAKVLIDQMKIKTTWPGEYWQTIHAQSSIGGPSICNGDSGSGYYVKKGSDFIYIGAQTSMIGGATNCSGQPWTSDLTIMGMSSGYENLELIQEAENYVKLHPVKMTTITCKKLSLTKKITGFEPKCPVGYKVKV